MVEQEYIKNQLALTKCYKCGEPLASGVFAVLSNSTPLVTIGHVVCSKCNSQNIVTLTMAGNAAVPAESDLTSEEVGVYTQMKEVSYIELINLHQALKRESVCKLLRKSGKLLERKIKK